MTTAGSARPHSLRPVAHPAVPWLAGLATGAALAVWVAADANVRGVSAVPVVARVAIATVAVFLACGYAPAVYLTPARLGAWWPLLVLPFGAITSGLALTVLGFAAIPFHFALGATLLAGIVLAFRAPPPAVDRQRAPVWLLAVIAMIAALIVAIALIPTFRSGLATVTGFGSDAHLVAGSATFLQHNYPSSTNPAYPADQVPPLWRSKYPIYYALAAVSSIAGVEPWQALMTVSAILLALAGLGFFLLAREGFGAPLGAAAVAMVVATLDRRVFHLALHPYYNQLWGMVTLPFTVLAAYLYATAPTRRGLGMLVLFAAVGVFAYPLMLPFPAIAGIGAWLLSGHRLRPRKPSRRALLWIVPLCLLLIVPIIGVAQKIGTAVGIIFSPGSKLIGWQGDLQHYPPTAEFFVVPGIGPTTVVVIVIIALGYLGLRRAPKALGRPLAVVLTLGLAAAVFFASVRYGQYFYFKILSFTGPQFLTAAAAFLGFVAVGAGRSALRAVATVAMAALVVGAVFSARDEIKQSYDQLTPETIQLRDWAAKLPAGASIRLDTARPDQLWQAYMLSSHPLGSRDPITNYPHVPVTAGADYALDEVLFPPPPDAVGPPIERNADLRLWKLRAGGPDTTSRRMVPTFSGTH